MALAAEMFAPDEIIDGNVVIIATPGYDVRCRASEYLQLKLDGADARLSTLQYAVIPQALSEIVNAVITPDITAVYAALINRANQPAEEVYDEARKLAFANSEPMFDIGIEGCKRAFANGVGTQIAFKANSACSANVLGLYGESLLGIRLSFAPGALSRACGLNPLFKNRDVSSIMDMIRIRA